MKQKHYDVEFDCKVNDFSLIVKAYFPLGLLPGVNFSPFDTDSLRLFLSSWVMAVALSYFGL